MGTLKGMAAAAAIAAAAALAVVALPHGDAARPQPDLAVFQPERVSKLGRDNLVDALIAQSFKVPIRRTDLKGAVLSIDYAVQRDTDMPELIAADMKKLIGLAFYQASNVDRLLVRYVEAREDAVRFGGSDGYALLLAADVRRGDRWLSGSFGEVEAADLLHDPVWRQRLRLSFTGSWLGRFGTLPER